MAKVVGLVIQHVVKNRLGLDFTFFPKRHLTPEIRLAGPVELIEHDLKIRIHSVRSHRSVVALKQEGQPSRKAAQDVAIDLLGTLGILESGDHWAPLLQRPAVIFDDLSPGVHSFTLAERRARRPANPTSTTSAVAGSGTASTRKSSTASV